ncbi:MAG: hypothetical protein QM702_21815 [Rubrivivax sp.]
MTRSPMRPEPRIPPAALALLPALALSLAAVAQAQPAEAPPPAAAASADAPAPKIAPLLLWVLQTVAGEAVHQASTGEPSGLFKRLKERFQPAAVAAAVAGAGPTPAIGYAMEQLDPETFAVLKPVAVGGREPPTLRSGDVFAVQFSTSLPGLVTLQNVDAQGRSANLGTYPVLADQLNRIPRDRGIRLEGDTGVERLRFLFRPCLHAAPLSRPSDYLLAGRLPACSAAERQRLNAAASGAVTPRAMVNLEQPDNTMAFAGSADFQPEDVTLVEAQIRHEPRR